MYKYHILPHTADVRLKVSGKNLNELFEAALAGMNEIIKPGFCAKKTKPEYTQPVALEARNVTELLVGFLSEVLALSHEKKCIFCEVRFLEFLPTKLSAELRGSAQTSFEEDIKAVTYHEAEVRQNPDASWETVLVFDI